MSLSLLYIFFSLNSDRRSLIYTFLFVCILTRYTYIFVCLSVCLVNTVFYHYYYYYNTQLLLYRDEDESEPRQESSAFFRGLSRNNYRRGNALIIVQPGVQAEAHMVEKFRRVSSHKIAATCCYPWST